MNRRALPKKEHNLLCFAWFEKKSSVFSFILFSKQKRRVRAFCIHIFLLILLLLLGLSATGCAKLFYA